MTKEQSPPEDKEPYYPCQEFFAVMGFYPVKGQRQTEQDEEDIE